LNGQLPLKELSRSHKNRTAEVVAESIM